MSAGKYLLRKLAGGYAYFAEIAVEIRFDAGAADDTISFETGCFQSIGDLTRWKAACMFGAMYAIEHMATPKQKGAYHMRFTKVRGYVVDTTTTTIAFAACYAVWNALGVDVGHGPLLDEKTGQFRFPR